MRRDAYRPGGWHSGQGDRHDGISRGFRPGPGGWFATPGGYDEGYENPALWLEELPGDRRPVEPHHRAFHGYLRSAERRPGRPVVRIADRMTANPEALTPESTLAEAAQWMQALGVGLLPVVENRGTRRLIGHLTERDLVVHGLAQGKDGSARVRECMTREAVAVNRNDDPVQALRMMRARRLTRIPVVDREGRLVGILEEGDLPEATGVGATEGSRARWRGEAPLPDTSHFRGGFVFGPTDRGGDVGFRPEGVRGLDEW